MEVRIVRCALKGKIIGPVMEHGRAYDRKADRPAGRLSPLMRRGQSEPMFAARRLRAQTIAADE
jgi:hypothetical protein